MASILGEFFPCDVVPALVFLLSPGPDLFLDKVWLPRVTSMDILPLIVDIFSDLVPGTRPGNEVLGISFSLFSRLLSRR